MENVINFQDAKEARDAARNKALIRAFVSILAAVVAGTAASW